MDLTLKIIRFNNRPPDNGLSHTWSGKGGTIGRSTTNDWVLPDPFVSGQHAMIEYRNGDYFISDTSTNGLYLNRSTSPLGKGNVAQLQAGDHIRMGFYEVDVLLESDSKVGFSNGLALEPNWNESQSTGNVPDNGCDCDQYLAPNNVASDDDDPFKDMGNAHAGADSSQPLRPPVIPSRVVDLPISIPDLAPPPSSRSAGELPSEWWKESVMKPSPVITPPLDVLPDKDPSPPAAISPAPPLPSKPVQVTPPVFSPSQSEAIQAFLLGAGIRDEHKLTALQVGQDMETLGRLFRIALQGTLDALHSRAEVKSAMRMDMTTAQRIGNNPLKFTVTSEDALLRLLAPRSEAYLPPEQALLEAFDDIRAHQIAVIAGVQAALKHVLKRFEPAGLVERLEKNNPISANIPIQRQAKLWDLFTNLYATLEQECTDDFQRLFGLEFARAYDAQMVKLKGGQGHG